MGDYTLAYVIGLMAGSIFFIDGWGPSDKNEDFIKSRRFRGLSILIAGGIITPVLDYVTQNRKPEFFLSYLRGAVLGWFFVPLLGLVIYLIWKSTKDAGKKSMAYKTGEFLYSILDFIYLGISDNPHLNAKRESEVNVATNKYKLQGEYELQNLRDELQKKEDAPSQLDAATKKKIEEYEEKLKNTKTESDYVFRDWYYKGLTEFEKREFEKTIAYMKNALEKDPADEFAPDAYLYMAISYASLSLLDKGLEYSNRIINSFPHYKNLYLAYNNRGAIYDRMGRQEEALHDYDKSIELNPGYGLSQFNKAALLHRMNKSGEALPYIEKALQLEQGNAAYWNARAFILAALNRFDEALVSMDNAIKADPANSTYQYTRQQLIQEHQKHSGTGNVSKINTDGVKTVQGV